MGRRPSSAAQRLAYPDLPTAGQDAGRVEGPWDTYKLIRTMSGPEAFGSLVDSTGPLVKK
jgi:hypothetical protein